MLRRALLTLGWLLLTVSAALAQGVPISALPSATVPLTGSELMVVMQNGAAKKATVLQVGQAFTLGGTCSNCTLAGTTTNTGTISGGTISGATLAGDTLSGTTTNSGTISGGIISGATLVGVTLPSIANNTVLGNVSGGSAAPAALTATQLTTLVNAFSGTLSGAAPASGGGTTNFLRADGAWAVPPGPAQPYTLAQGGTGAALTASNGGIVWSNASTLAILSGTATANQLLLSGSTAAPVWSTLTHPSTVTVNRLLWASATNVISDLATANSGVLVTSAGGVPSISSTLPSGLSIPTPTITGHPTVEGVTSTGATGTGPFVFGTSPSIASPTFTGTVAGANTIPLSILAQSGANTMIGNWTAGSANVLANTMPSCADSGGNHLNYVNGTGVTCGTSSSASSAFTKISAVSASNSTSIDLTSVFSSTYNEYEMDCVGIVFVAGADPLIQFGVSGTYKTAGSYFNQGYQTLNGTQTQVNTSGSSGLRPAAGNVLAASTSETMTFRVRISGPMSATTNRKLMQARSTWATGTSSTTFGVSDISAQWTGDTVALTDIRFWDGSANNIASGTCTVYGLTP